MLNAVIENQEVTFWSGAGKKYPTLELPKDQIVGVYTLQDQNYDFGQGYDGAVLLRCDIIDHEDGDSRYEDDEILIGTYHSYDLDEQADPKYRKIIAKLKALGYNAEYVGDESQ